MSNYMETGKALAIVHAMATRLYKDHGEICAPADCPADAALALLTVEDLIVNNFEAEDTITEQAQAEFRADNDRT